MFEYYPRSVGDVRTAVTSLPDLAESDLPQPPTTGFSKLEDITEEINKGTPLSELADLSVVDYVSRESFLNALKTYVPEGTKVELQTHTPISVSQLNRSPRYERTAERLVLQNLDGVCNLSRTAWRAIGWRDMQTLVTRSNYYVIDNMGLMAVPARGEFVDYESLVSPLQSSYSFKESNWGEFVSD
ncbi:MAG: hypothetical protein WAR37_04615 [Candidatus Microsaccharimonas sp.]